MKEEKIIIEEVSPRDYDKEDYKIKIIIVGDSGVGKTNLITRFASDNKYVCCGVGGKLFKYFTRNYKNK